MRLVPITVAICFIFRKYQFSGFAFSNAIVQSSSDGDKLQLGSSTLVSGGAVQITGGTGNLLLPQLMAPEM